ncbi:MAG: NAD(P)/FAD-dependent oxidoreductase [Alphaproteobacteria bacterium]
MVERVDCIVIGAGVVGLACAKFLAEAGREVIVLEATDMIGSETSSRNSEVIHAGIYYPTGSFKAKACVEGNRFLYAYCAERGIPHKRLGKLIVASEESEAPRLQALKDKAAENGVHDLEIFSAKDIEQMEPAVRCVGGLLSPSTGVIDSHSLMLAYQGDAEAAGAMIAFLSPVIGGRIRPEGGVEVDVGGEEPMTLAADLVVNSAGLDAVDIASRFDGAPVDKFPTASLAKGNYFSLLGKQPFSRLVYPMPVPGALGVHVTVDLGGQCKFGPDIEWIQERDYDMDPSRADSFYAAVRAYYPGLEDGALVPSYAGIRPKIHGPGEPQPDFMVQGPVDHGIDGLINLFGIESPGLTASPAVAQAVLRLTNR